MGIDFVKAVKGRLESLRNQKNNYALFDGLTGTQKEISTEAFKKMSVTDLRQFTLEFYNTNLKGKKVAIKNHLKQVDFISDAGRKILKPIYSEKIAVLEHFEELIKTSTYNNWGERKNTDSPSVLGYLNFKSKIIIDGIKRHVRIAIMLDNQRKTKLKSFEVGKKEKSDKSREVHFGNPKDEGKKSLSNNKDTKKTIPATKTIKKPLNGIIDTVLKVAPMLLAPVNNNKNSLASRLQAKANTKQDYYIIPDRNISNFLGKVEKKNKESVAITIAGGQGSMKTRLCFQLMNAFAQNYKVGHASIEEHPDSALYFDKAKQYCNNKALHNISAPEINSIDDVHKLVRENDVIVIDSFSKLQEMQKGLELDKDFRKAYDGKLFIIIYQLTSDGKMRGGTKSQFDGDCIAFIEKAPNYKDNYCYWDKNRYNSKPELKYNIFSGKLQGDTPEASAEPTQTIKSNFSFNLV